METKINQAQLLQLLADFEATGKEARNLGDDMYAYESEVIANIIREVLQYRQAGMRVPDGWKLVPIIAFPSQWAAGQKAFHSAGINKVDAVYKAMVAAAPTAPEQEV